MASNPNSSTKTCVQCQKQDAILPEEDPYFCSVGCATAFAFFHARSVWRFCPKHQSWYDISESNYAMCEGCWEEKELKTYFKSLTSALDE